MKDIVPEKDDTIVSTIALSDKNNTSIDIKVDSKILDEALLSKDDQKLLKRCDILTEEYQKSLRSILSGLTNSGKIVVHSSTYIVSKNGEILTGRDLNLALDIGLLAQCFFLSVMNFAKIIKMTVEDLLQLFLKTVSKR